MKQLARSLTVLWTMLTICCVGYGWCADEATSTTVADGPSAPHTTHTLAVPRHDVPGVKNLAKISDALYRGAQPTAEGFRELKKLGVRTVVNLRSFHSDRDELKGTGLRYAHIYSQAWDPDDEDVLAFLKIVADPANQPIFVHCMHGADRTGWFVAFYRVVEQGWSVEDAWAEMQNFGHHEVFRGLRRHLFKLDPARVREQLKSAKTPRIRVIGD